MKDSFDLNLHYFYHLFFRAMECKLCSTKCANINEYIKHCRTHKKKSYQVQIPYDSCSLILTSASSFYKHHTSHKKKHEPKTAVLICSYCQEKFFSYECFKSHIKKHYPQVEISCPRCNKRNLSSFRAFQMHFNRHHKSSIIKSQKVISTTFENEEIIVENTFEQMENDAFADTELEVQ